MPNVGCFKRSPLPLFLGPALPRNPGRGKEVLTSFTNNGLTRPSANFGRGKEALINLNHTNSFFFLRYLVEINQLSKAQEVSVYSFSVQLQEQGVLCDIYVDATAFNFFSGFVSASLTVFEHFTSLSGDILMVESLQNNLLAKGRFPDPNIKKMGQKNLRTYISWTASCQRYALQPKNQRTFAF